MVLINALVAELVDAQDLKSCGSQIPCRFKSGLRHHFYWRSTQVWLKGPVLKTGRSCKRRRGSNPFSSASNIAGWSSLVARWAHNPKVRGSNPLPATNLFLYGSLVQLVNTFACHAKDRGFESRRNRHLFGFIAQSVEQGTENPCVAGSIPAGATILLIIIFTI